MNINKIKLSNLWIFSDIQNDKIILYNSFENFLIKNNIYLPEYVFYDENKEMTTNLNIEKRHHRTIQEGLLIGTDELSINSDINEFEEYIKGFSKKTLKMYKKYLTMFNDEGIKNYEKCKNREDIAAFYQKKK